MEDKPEDVDENRLRDELIEQLRTSLAKSWEMITNPHLDVTTRERWTQIHTRAAVALNQILKDRQYKDWEKRLKELEASGHIPRRTILSREPANNDGNRSKSL